MNEHLTPDELHAFRTKGLPAQRIVAAARHLETCDACARLARSQTSAAAWIDVVAAIEEHPSNLDAYVDGALATEEAQAIDEHLAGCAICREDVADLRALQPAAPRRVSWMPFAAAIAIAVAGLAIYVSNEAPDQRTRVEPQPKAIQRAAPKAEPAPSAPPAYANGAWATLVRDARERGIVPLPDLSDLRAEADTFRGEVRDRAKETFAPAGEVVEHARPLFTWPARKAARAVVSVFAKGERIAHSKRLQAASWRPDRDLPRGVLLTWQVAIDGMILPAPPNPPAMFRIATETVVDELDEARRTHANDHLLLGLLYARHGILTDAERELQHYGDPRLLEAVRKGRR